MYSGRIDVDPGAEWPTGATRTNGASDITNWWCPSGAAPSTGTSAECPGGPSPLLLSTADLKCRAAWRL